MKNETRKPAREVVLTCRINGTEVTLAELAAEVVRCGGIVRKGK